MILNKLREKLDETVKVNKVVAIIVTTYIIVFGLHELYINTIGYTNYIPNKTAKELVEIFEDTYKYKEILDMQEYKDHKDSLLNQLYISKKDYYLFNEKIKELANDPYTYFLYGENYEKSKNSSDEFHYEILNDEVGYIKFKRFKDGAGANFENTLKEFTGKRIKFLAIDLCNNRGGAAKELHKISDLLLPEAQVYTEITSLNYDMIYKSNADHYDFEKIFVFLDKNSASCSEVLALSLKENLKDKVVLIGKETEGKGVGQDLVENRKYRFIHQIVYFDWHVDGKNVEDLKNYLLVYGDRLPNDPLIDDYKNIMFELMKTAL